jgi:hypothetical protein
MFLAMATMAALMNLFVVDGGRRPGCLLGWARTRLATPGRLGDLLESVLCEPLELRNFVVPKRQQAGLPPAASCRCVMPRDGTEQGDDVTGTTTKRGQ